MGKKLKIVGGGVLSVVVLIGGWIGYVSATYDRDFGAIPKPAVTASKDPEVIARGAYVVHAVAHCTACHGPGDYANHYKLSPDKSDLSGGYILRAGPFGTFYPPNLNSDPETGIAKRTDAELARVIRHGVGADGRYLPLMAFAVGPMADEDLVAVVSYLRTLPPKKNATKRDEWGFLAKALSSKFLPRMSVAPPYVPEGLASVERGKYLAEGPALCSWCHTPTDPMKGFAVAGAPFSGAAEPEPDHEDPTFEIVAPNITSDKETGKLAAYSEEAFVNKFKVGGRAFEGSVMPWDNFKQMTENDLRSIYRYLMTVPPAQRNVGPTRRAIGSYKPH